MESDERDEYGTTPLHRAAQAGDLSAVCSLLAAGADVNESVEDSHAPDPNWLGFSALHFAAANGRVAVVKTLLEAGANVNAADTNGDTPLHYAAENGATEIVSLLLKQGATPNAANEEGGTPLHYAATNGHVAVVQSLLEAGADVNARCTIGSTPLHFAAMLSSTAEVVSLLLKEGATPTARNEDGCTPLHYAAETGAMEAVHLLLRAGADIDATTNEGLTPLWCAARQGHGDVCYLLINQWNAERTPDLSHAAATSGDVDTLLTCRGPDRMCDGDVDAEGRSLLHEAAMYAKAAMCKYLLTGSVFMEKQDPNARDSQGRTPLHYLAAHAERKERRRKQAIPASVSTPPGTDTLNTYKALRENGARTTLQDDSGRTPLHEAARSGSVVATMALLTVDKAYSSVGKKDKDGRIPLHLAAADSGEVVVVNDLLGAGADVNARDKAGQTPLHAAMANTQVSIELLKALLAAGADPNAKDREGRTAEDVARTNDNRLAGVILHKAVDQHNQRQGPGR
jgi:ankyrin repeat protein